MISYLNSILSFMCHCWPNQIPGIPVNIGIDHGNAVDGDKSYVGSWVIRSSQITVIVCSFGRYVQREARRREALKTVGRNNG